LHEIFDFINLQICRKMAGRVKIKSKTVKATLKNKDVLDMFQGVLGSSDNSVALSITWPKFKNIQNQTDRMIRLLAALRDSRAISLFPAQHTQLVAYVQMYERQRATSFVIPEIESLIRTTSTGIEGVLGVDKPENDYTGVSPELVVEFNACFATIKKCALVNNILAICKNMIPYKKFLSDIKALKDKFLTKASAASVDPLPELALNFRQIYIDDRLGPMDKEFILLVLHKLQAISHDMYDALSAPDIDVNEFVQVIMGSIGDVKKHIPRCDAAFAKIIESVSLLKNNFGDYYKDFTASGNPTIIMENFVLDVAKGSSTSPTVTAQFRKIISHYRKLASQQASNPKLQSLFAQVDKNFEELDSHHRGEKIEEDSSDESDTELVYADPEPAEPAAATPAAPVVDEKQALKNAVRNRKKRAKKAARAVAAGEEAAVADAEGDAEGEAADAEGEAADTNE